MSEIFASMKLEDLFCALQNVITNKKRQTRKEVLFFIVIGKCWKSKDNCYGMARRVISVSAVLTAKDVLVRIYYDMISTAKELLLCSVVSIPML